MPQSLAKNLVHLVFSTNNREAILSESVRDPFCAYASAVLRDLDSPVIAINAWRDHVHILSALSKNHSLAQIVMEVKRATSKWIKTQGKPFAKFHWQSGYGAFSICQSGVERGEGVHCQSSRASPREKFRGRIPVILEALSNRIR